MSEVALRLGKFLAIQIGGGWELSVQEKDRGISLGKCRVKFEWEQKVVSSNVACPPPPPPLLGHAGPFGEGSTFPVLGPLCERKAGRTQDPSSPRRRAQCRMLRSHTWGSGKGHFS